MRICFISNPNAPHTIRWVNWFANAGHTVCLVADTPLERPLPGIEVYDLSKVFHFSLLRWFIWAAWLRRFLGRWKPDILHAHRVSAAGWLAASSGFHPLVVTPWGSDLYTHPQRSRLAKRLAHWVLGQADLVTADAVDLLQLALRFGAPEPALRLVEWGVDRSLFSPAPPDPALRSKIGLGSGPVILSLRAVKQVYNLHVLVAAFAQVIEQVPGVQLLLRDYDADPAYRQEVLRLVKELRLEASVHWLGRVEPWEELAPVYNLADIAVSVPASDGTPVSVLEAMACGLPVIVSELPALREWIIPGQNGLLVPAGQPGPLAKALLSLLNQPQLIARFAEYNRLLIAQRADHQIEMAKMEAYYQSLLAQPTE